MAGARVQGDKQVVVARLDPDAFRNRGSQGDAAVCNNGVPPPVSVIALSDRLDACTEPANLESIGNRTARRAIARFTREAAATEAGHGWWYLDSLS